LRVTGEDGVAVISVKEAVEFVKATGQSALIDYNSKLEDCLEEILIRSCSGKEAKGSWRILDKNKRNWSVPQPLIDDLRNSQNHLYKPQEIKLTLDTPAPERIADLLIEKRTL
jgi:hypothetical protein